MLYFVLRTHMCLQGDIQDKALALQAVRVKDVSCFSLPLLIPPEMSTYASFKII